MLVTGFVSISTASAAPVPFAKRCAWAPNNPEVCEARRYCEGNPRNSRCAVYCRVNPRDVVCGTAYVPQLPRVYPNGDTPYPWARNGGGFCSNNPGNIACQHDWFRWAY